MELLRQALNAERWTLDGISYGSYVAERYSLAHPSRVRRLVLDSVVPHDGSVQLLAPAMRRAAAVLRLACRSGPRCVGDPANDLAAVVRARHNGTALLDALVNLGLVDWTYRTSFDVPGSSTKHGSETARNSRPCSRQRRVQTRSRPMS
jgi:pimeloyl-ACP methyl ester carboxylesterase